MPPRHAKRIDRASSDWWNAHDRIVALPGGSTVLLAGPCGTGKTQLAVNAIGHACRRLQKARYARLYDIMLELRGAMNSDRGGVNESEILGRYSAFDLLVIDELQERTGSDYESLMLGLLLDRRYFEARTTILITNLETGPALELLGPRIVSRMREDGAVVLCNWPSFRAAQRQENHPDAV